VPFKCQEIAQHESLKRPRLLALSSVITSQFHSLVVSLSDMVNERCFHGVHACHSAPKGLRSNLFEQNWKSYVDLCY